MSDLDTLVPQGLSSFNAWLSKNNAGPWSITALTDAQKESLLWIGTSVIFILAFWRGIPWKSHWPRIMYVDEDILREDGEEVWRFKRILLLKYIPLLVPLKYLTVLFHEISHAIVGTVTGGQVTLIMVDSHEGGATHFASDGGEPSYVATLPAGYIGSCMIGCTLVILGFDTLWSKYAFLAFEMLVILSLLICLATIPKSFFMHHYHEIKHRVHRLLGNEDRAKEHKANHDEKEDKLKEHAINADEHVHPEAKGDLPSAEKRMASAELIIFNNLFIGGIVAVAWYLSDSIYLRFVIIFIGVMNALYAIWDIYLDGIKYNTVNSDATLMMKELSRRRRKKQKKAHSTTYYSVMWLVAQLVLLSTSIIIGLYLHQTTIAEQAIRSRDFLPSPNHYGPADLFAQASDSLSNTAQDIQGLFGDSEEPQGEL